MLPSLQAIRSSVGSFFPRFKKTPRRLLYFGTSFGNYPGELRALARAPFFSDLLKRSDPLVQEYLGWSPLARLVHDKTPEVLIHEDSRMHECLYQLCILEKIKNDGIPYDLVAGLSLGEIASAHAAGCCDFENAVLICACTTKTLRNLQGTGFMAVSAFWTRVQALVEQHGLNCYCSIHGISRSSWSGYLADLELLGKVLESEGIKCQHLLTHCTFHSPLIDASIVQQSLQSFQAQAASVPFYSSVTGTRMKVPPDSGHWSKLMTHPSLFLEMFAALAAQPFDEIISIGSVDSKKMLQGALTKHGRKARILDALPMLRSRSLIS
jgi:acyl transferase domain-containing protein